MAPEPARTIDIQTDPLLKPREAASRLTISVRTLYRLRSQGLISSIRVGGTNRFALSEVNRLLNEGVRHG